MHSSILLIYLIHLTDILDILNNDVPDQWIVGKFVIRLLVYTANKLDWYITNKLDKDALEWVDKLYNDALRFKKMN